MGNPASNARGRPLALALAIGLAAGFGLGGLVFRGWAARPPASATPASPHGPPDLLAFVPDGVQFVGQADLASVRGAPWFQSLTGQAGRRTACEDRLLQRVEQVTVVVDGAPFDRFALAFTGPLTRDELLACAAARRDGERAPPVRDHVRGGDRIRWLPPSDPNLLPPASSSEIVYLDGGVVLAGTSELVERMLDRARMDTREVPAVIDALHRRLAGHPSAWAAFVGHPSQLDEVPSMHHVTGIAMGVTFGDPVSTVLDFACDDYDAPRPLADDLTTLTARLGTAMNLVPHVVARPSLSAILQQARVERGAADVRVRLTLNDESWTTLVTAVSGLATLLAQDAPSPSSPTPDASVP